MSSLCHVSIFFISFNTVEIRFFIGVVYFELAYFSEEDILESAQDGLFNVYDLLSAVHSVHMKLTILVSPRQIFNFYFYIDKYVNCNMTTY